jgi:hypothetical protein
LLVLLTSCAKIVDETKGVSNICPLHRAHMEKRNVEIAYGYTRPTSAAAAAIADFNRQKLSLFPFGETEATGACEVPAGGPHFVRIFVCRECVVAAEAWRKARQANKAPEPTSGSVTPRATEGVSK